MIFSGATGISGRVVDNVFLYIVVICVFLLGLITFLMVYFVIRYRREKHPQPADIEGSTWLEITWTVIPTLIVLTMFYYGLTGFQFLKKVPEGAMVVKVIARQWSWLFQYENGIQDGELRVPVGKPVKLLLTSQDVIHGFYAPAFRIKQDAVPGMTNYLWFQPTETGTFDVMCSQYCGLEHSHMLSKIVVLPEAEFTKWYESKKGEMATKVPSRGIKLYQEKGCAGCHSLDGSRRVGPSFKDLFGKTEEVITAGKERKVVVDEAFIRRFILEPNVDHIEGYPPIMPKIQLTDEEINALVEFIKTQSKEGEKATKLSSQGPQLYQEKGCVGCHSTDGTPRVGPSFKGLFGKTEKVTMAGKEQTVVADENFIRRFISEPNVVHIEGYPPIMPKISMTDEELTALVDYIKSLK